MNNVPSLRLSHKLKIQDPNMALIVIFSVVMSVCEHTNTQAEIITVAQPGAIAFSIGPNHEIIAPLMLQNFRECLGSSFEVELYTGKPHTIFTILHLA
jgi:hypothetical protein